MGYYPAKIVTLLNIVLMEGYATIDCIIGGQVLSAVSGGSMTIAVGIAMMTPSEIYACDHGVAAKIKRVIMDKDTYPRCWGAGPRAQRKKELKRLGLLDEKGKPTPNTPQDWVSYYISETNNNIVANGQENGQEEQNE